MWRPINILSEYQYTFYGKTNTHFMWRPIHILSEDQYTFYVKTNTHFMWRPMHILCEDQYTFYVKTNTHFIWRPLHILRKDQYTFFIISRSVPLRMRNVSDKRCRENQNKRFKFNIFVLKSCRLCDNVGKYCTAGQVIEENVAHVRCNDWNTHLGHVILIALAV
jgi:hypothetical protein